MNRIKTAILTFIAAMAMAVTANFSAYAAGSASLYVSPASASYDHNQSFSITVLANTAGENVNAVEVDLSYTDSLLTFSSFSASGSAFDIEAPGASGGSGGIQMTRASATSKTGSAVNVVTLNFVTKSTDGTATISFGGNSKVVRSSDSTDVLGSTSGGSYAIQISSTPAPSTPDPESAAPSTSDGSNSDAGESSGSSSAGGASSSGGSSSSDPVSDDVDTEVDDELSQSLDEDNTVSSSESMAQDQDEVAAQEDRTTAWLLGGMAALILALTAGAYFLRTYLTKRALNKVMTNNPEAVQGVGSLEFKLGSSKNMRVIGKDDTPVMPQGVIKPQSNVSRPSRPFGAPASSKAPFAPRDSGNNTPPQS